MHNVLMTIIKCSMWLWTDEVDSLLIEVEWLVGLRIRIITYKSISKGLAKKTSQIYLFTLQENPPFRYVSSATILKTYLDLKYF